MIPISFIYWIYPNVCLQRTAEQAQAFDFVWPLSTANDCPDNELLVCVHLVPMWLVYNVSNLNRIARNHGIAVAQHIVFGCIVAQRTYGHNNSQLEIDDILAGMFGQGKSIMLNNLLIVE